jgi:gluconolactonase
MDLLDAGGLTAVAGEWRVREAEVVPVDFLAAGSDGQPGAAPSRTFDVEPQAGWSDFDDSAWPVVPPGELSRRLGGGKLSFAWYRLKVTLPESIGGVPVAGSEVVFETVVDDAAEVWVDGELRRCPGQAGGSMVAGWGAPNRVVVARDARPGRTLRLAVFGVNGPLSGSPTNYVWMRRARLELVAADPEAARARAVSPACEENVLVERFDPRIDAILSRNPKAFLVAEGFTFAEGPVWDPADGGSLLFSDPNENRIYRWREAGGLAVLRERSGYAGADLARYRQPGSNGLAIDARGRLYAAQHGNRRLVRIERDGAEAVIAAGERGGRFNSPNDLALRSDGSVYLTDPFFGLPGFEADPAKELPYQGVYRVAGEGAGARVELLTNGLSGPNGLAFSPDERFLYVGNWDDHRKIVVRHPVLADGRLGGGTVFADLTGEPGEDAIDGVKTDGLGNVYVSGPGGVWIFAPDGARLGRVRTPRHAHNLAWGEDGTVLYLAARDHLYRLPTRVRGHAPHLAPPPRVVRTAPRFARLLAPGAAPELVALGHHWLEGPAWDGARGELVYSDIPRNAIFALAPGARPRRIVERSGYSGSAPFAGREPGSNGLVFDREGRLLACQHGDRRVVRFERDGSTTVLADRFAGRRLNSPNDAIVTGDGEVWFTDPPFGLPRGFDDPAKELPFSGVYRITAAGEVQLLTSEVRAPNGLALALDGKTLYVSNAEPEVNAAVYAFAVRTDRTLGPPRRFVDLTRASQPGAPGAPDGLEVDRDGNLWLAGPGGIRVYDPRARLLGRIDFDRPAANLEFGGDGYLYVTADTAIWRFALARAAR